MTTQPLNRSITALILSNLVTQPPGLIIGLLLIEIAESFNIPIAQAAYLQTATSTMAVVSGAVMGILAIKNNYKTLMTVGLTLFIISSISNYLAPTFTIMLLTYSLVGIGGSMISPMASAYVGILVPREKRSKIISYFFAFGAIFVLLGAPYISTLQNLWGWKTPFLLFALPISLIALIFVYLYIPNYRSESLIKTGYLKGFRHLFANKSALTCIAGTILTEATWSISSVFGITYIRQATQIPSNQAWMILVATSLCFLAGSLLGGYLVNILGRKKLVTLTTTLIGVLTISYLNSSIPLLSTILVLATCFFSSMRYTASESLSLEQVPEMRGTMMSMNSIALAGGAVLGSGAGGYILMSNNYSALGLIGLLSIIASVLYHLYTVDVAKK